MFFNYLNEGIYPERKDLKRINDMLAKAKDTSHLAALATKMANSITDLSKAERRYGAAKQIIGGTSPVTIIFAKRCIELGSYNNDIETLVGKIDQLKDKEIQQKQAAIENIPEPVPEPEVQQVSNASDDMGEISQKAIEKATKEFNANTSDEYDINTVNDQALLKNTPLKYVEEVQRIHKIIGNKLKQYNITKIIQEITSLPLKYNRYVKEVNDIKYHANTGVVSFSFVFGPFKLRNTGYSWYNGKCGWINVKNIEISLIDMALKFSNTNNMTIRWKGTSNDETSQIKNDSTLALYNIGITSQCKDYMTYIQIVINALQNKILHLNGVEDVFKEYASFITSIYGDNYDADLLAKFRFNYEHQSQREKLYERITYAICAHFDVDDESDENWPGFVLSGDEHGNLLFMPYHAGHFIRAVSAGKGGRGVRSYRPTSKSAITGLTASAEMRELGKWLKASFGKNNVTYVDTNSATWEGNETTYFSVPTSVVKNIIEK